MSHFGDFMDGVSVKISEKYKRPPRIVLPYSVSECPLRAQNVVDSAEYCCTFENNVLSKLKELRSAKETKKNERRHRLQLLEEAKQKKLDEIAAVEAQEKLKQLSVSEVSYPSTDEISALTPDDNNDKTLGTSLTQDSPEHVDLVNEVPYTVCNTEPEHTILQPTQVQTNYQQNNLLDDPDPLQELKMNMKITKIPQYSNIDTLTYKDFENDTSSPFDNVELNTINEMEQLAQVLQSQRESATSCQPQPYMPEQIYNVPNCASQVNMEGMTYIPNAYMEQPIQGPSAMYSPQHYPTANGYYIPTDNTIDNTIQMDNMNMYMQNYQYYIPPTSYPVVDPTYYGSQMPNPEVSIPNGSPYVHNYYYQYPQVPMQYSANSYVVQNQNSETNDNSNASQHTIKSRSRSVPDIVKELNDEINSAKRRANERSYNASPAPKLASQASNQRKEERKSKRKSERLPNPFEELSPKLQGICKQIHGMGFPLDRVARICKILGDNDKKIIEALLLQSELMDLGFSERRVTAALTKHEFNREKALDELVL